MLHPQVFFCEKYYLLVTAKLCVSETQWNSNSKYFWDSATGWCWYLILVSKTKTESVQSSITRALILLFACYLSNVVPYDVGADPNLSAWKNQRQYSAGSIYCFWMNTTSRACQCSCGFALIRTSKFQCVQMCYHFIG